LNQKENKHKEIVLELSNQNLYIQAAEAIISLWVDAEIQASYYAYPHLIHTSAQWFIPRAKLFASTDLPSQTWTF
jgi:hypothetical protein